MDLTDFENDFYDMLEEIKFKKYNNHMMAKITQDLKELKKSNKMILFADKTNNIYKVNKNKYEELLRKNVTKDYIKTNNDAVDKINNEAAELIMKNDIQGKIPKYELQECFITAKDHKKDFRQKNQCRLLNPSKTYMAKISKKILDKINSAIREKSSLIQWPQKTW